MFGWGRRRDAQAVEAMREQLAAADMHARSVLAAVAQTDSRWTKDREDRARVQQSTEGTLEQVRSSAAENAADITRALHHVAEMCALVVERLDADRLERRALTDAINLLVRQQQSPLETPSQVLGGMVLASPEAPYAPEAPRNGDASHNGVISLNGDAAHAAPQPADEISLADYEDEPAPSAEPFGTVAPFGTVEANRSAEPFRAVEVIAPARTAAAPEPAPSVGTWDTVPQPRREEPAAMAPPEAVEPPPIVEPGRIFEPPRPYDAFAGLPLLQPVEPPKPFEPVAPPVAPSAAVEATPEPEASNGLDRQWTDSRRLTETSSFRPHGGTRLTPRRSTTGSSTR